LPLAEILSAEQWTSSELVIDPGQQALPEPGALPTIGEAVANCFSIVRVSLIDKIQPK
jgi:hypothetical protein